MNFDRTLSNCKQYKVPIFHTLSLSLSLPFPGLQWTVVDSNYPRFSLPACQSANLLGNGGGGAGSGGAGSQSSGANSAGGGGNSDQQRQQQHEAQQQQVATQQQQHLQQLHYQQQQQEQAAAAAAAAASGQAYSSQIITVNNLVSGYATAAQNLSPTSPNESNMVQSVYSQGPTPTQSPVHAGGASAAGGGNAGNANAGNGNATGAGVNQVVKRKRSVNPQGDENFIRALEAVRTGGIGFCKAARLYGVNNRTLWLEYKKRGYPVSRPSIKARVVKQEPNLSPSPTPSTNPGDDTTETLSMQIPPQADTPTPSSLMCTPHHAGIGGSGAGSLPGAGNSHPAIGVMSLFDPRYMDSPGNVHSMSRQRYIDATGGGGAGAGAGTGTGAGTINVNPTTAMNLQSINFNSI